MVEEPLAVAGVGADAAVVPVVVDVAVVAGTAGAPGAAGAVQPVEPDTPDTEPLLIATGLSKVYDGERVLNGQSLELAGGQSVALVGPSGSGKSTLLAILGLLLTPDTGSVTVRGIEARGLPEDKRTLLRQGCFGLVFQHTHLVGTLRAWENVAMPARFLPAADRRERGLGRRELERRAERLLVALGLEHRLHHYPHQMSVGQKRRVALARALVLDPPLILADEPTNDLDAESARLVTGMLFAEVERGKGLIIATHDPQLAARTAKRIDITPPSSPSPPPPR
jgi:putative ABC transport system ATP-binding protein